MKKFWNWIRDETAPDARILRLEGAIAEEKTGFPGTASDARSTAFT